MKQALNIGRMRTQGWVFGVSAVLAGVLNDTGFAGMAFASMVVSAISLVALALGYLDGRHLTQDNSSRARGGRSPS